MAITSMTKLAACGLAAMMAMSAVPAGAQTTEQTSRAATAAANAERARIRQANRDLILRRDATRDERRLYDLRRIQNDSGRSRAYEQQAPESHPANRASSTVRTQ